MKKNEVQKSLKMTLKVVTIKSSVVYSNREELFISLSFVCKLKIYENSKILR